VCSTTSGDGRGKWDKLASFPGIPAGSYTLARGFIPVGGR
jgi:hypothetical protein